MRMHGQWHGRLCADWPPQLGLHPLPVAHFHCCPAGCCPSSAGSTGCSHTRRALLATGWTRTLRWARRGASAPCCRSRASPPWMTCGRQTRTARLTLLCPALARCWVSRLASPLDRVSSYCSGLWGSWLHRAWNCLHTQSCPLPFLEWAAELQFFRHPPFK